MTVKQGRDSYTQSRQPTKPPTDPAKLRRSAVTQGRARYAAKRGDTGARDALDVLTGEEGTDAPMPPAA